ncbi:MAG: tRNA (adenosine(37)-N6)-threonylcarbamoyltransferase complex dimerization subunit type 1 TsaB [Chromatiales bacterium]|nr:tRNA (adenosine(37)-N6)-threonylcarbamoyltransferase complex dimerization subunit type 1 TsaB [Chromatiales bacterium]
MKILAIETATEACSAALYLDGNIQVTYQVEPRKHSELILPMLDQLLADSGIGLTQLDAVAFANGPGAFTGVRIATGVVQGVAYAGDLPVIRVSTLASLAQRAYRELRQGRLLCAFDARMNEVYWGCYQVNIDGLAVSVLDDQIAPPESVALPKGEGWYGVGTGWGSYTEQLSQRVGPALSGFNADLYCSAEDVALLASAVPEAQWVAADQALPVYLRDQVAKKPKKLL